jgi:hypothetical protein
VSGKCTLCCRVDLSKEDFGGNVGKKFREEIQAKLQKLMEPPPIKRDKASIILCCFLNLQSCSRLPWAGCKTARREALKKARRQTLPQNERKVCPFLAIHCTYKQLHL